MLYTLEQGPVERKILEMCVRDRVPIPKKMADAPELNMGIGLFYKAWTELGSERESGFGEGPIPWTAIDQYCRSLGIWGEIRGDLFYHVRGMDNEYLKFKANKAKREEGKGGK